MFCIKCGKDAIRGNFCAECFASRSTLFDMTNSTVYFCKMCNSHHLNGRKVDLDIFMADMITTKNMIREHHFAKKVAGNRIIITATCAGKIDGIPKKEIKMATLTVKNHKCEDCIKISGNYHEAIIQVRGGNSERIMKMIKCPDNILVGVEKFKYGYNIKITNKRKATEIAQMLRQKFSVNLSYKLVAEKKGIKLYRNYYAVR